LPRGARFVHQTFCWFGVRVSVRSPKSVCFALLFCAAATSVCAAEKKHDWEQAVVLSQVLGSTPAGAYAAPVGSGAVAVPINATSNTVTVETDHYRYVLSEPNLGGPIIFRRSYSSSPLILAVNDKVQFFRDGKWFIFMDSENKKHRFALVGETFLK
jgi:hypothetical protein